MNLTIAAVNDATVATDLDLAAVCLPTLRLIRYRIGDWTLDGIAPGQWRSEEV